MSSNLHEKDEVHTEHPNGIWTASSTKTLPTEKKSCVLILTYVDAVSTSKINSKPSPMVTYGVPLEVELDERGVVDLDDRAPRIVDERELARIRIRFAQEVDVTCQPMAARCERLLCPS